MNGIDLMNGDWIRHKDNKKDYKVTGIITQGDGSVLISTESHLSYDFMFEPIPLNAEIFFKLGFPYKETELGTEVSDFVWMINDEYRQEFMEIEFLEGEDEVPDFYAVKAYAGVNQINIQIQYLHHLQHILNLLGFEKEIEL